MHESARGHRHADGNNRNDRNLVGDIHEVFGLQKVRPAIAARRNHPGFSKRRKIFLQIGEHQPGAGDLRARDGVKRAAGRGDLLQRLARMLRLAFNDGEHLGAGGGEGTLEIVSEDRVVRLIAGGDQHTGRLAKLPGDGGADLLCRGRARGYSG